MNSAAHRIFVSLAAACAIAVSGMGGAAQAAAWVDPSLDAAVRKAQPTDTLAVYAVLKQQANLSNLLEELRQAQAPLAERHFQVVSEARRIAKASQGPLVSWLRTQQAAGQVDGFHTFWIANAVAIQARPAIIAQLAKRPELRSLYLDYPITLIRPVKGPSASALKGNGVENNILVTGATELWALGFDGTGTLACHQDTGVDGTHPALAERWRGLEPGVNPSEAWFDPIYHEAFPTDSGFHGTHTMGTIVGDDGDSNQIGMAPGARWIGAKTIDVPGGNIFSDAVAGFEWAADPDGDPTTMDDVPDVISNSWGLSQDYYGSCLDDFNVAIDTVEAAGVVVVFAAGNEGSLGLRSPGNRIASSTNTFAVGALNQDNTTLAWYSSIGPSDCDGLTIKPEITAVGTAVRSSLPGGSYGTLDGTSMATPAVAGAALLLRQAYPDATPEEIKTALYLSAHDLGAQGEDNSYGMGSLDVYEAYLWLKRHLVNSNGRVSVDDVFTCQDMVDITVADIDLVEQTITVTVASDTERSGELAVLYQSDDPGIYTGVMRLTDGGPSSSDQSLSVADGDSLLVTYVDEDDGEGNHDVDKTATAQVDCAPPVFAGLSQAVAGDYQVALSWSAAMDSQPVLYHVYRADAPGSQDFSHALSTTTALAVTDLTVVNGRTYYYVVRAEDALGQLEDNAVELSATPFGPTRIFTDKFETSTILEPWARVSAGKCRASWHAANCAGDGCSGKVAYVSHWECFPLASMDEQLVSPAVNLSGYTGIQLRFANDFDQGGKEYADVDYSLNGKQWVNVKRYRGVSSNGREVIDLPSLAGQSTVYIRFHFYNVSPSTDDWSIDDVELVGWPTARSR